MEPKINDSVYQLADLIKESSYTVFFGGAGVSTASNIPDFRGAKGIYTQNVSAEEILTPRFMRRYPDEYYRFYRKYFMLPGIRPNPAHEVLAKLEKQGLLQSVITQNVDGLHQAAGSHKVIELHGSAQRFYCSGCRKDFTYDEVDRMPLVPLCPDCSEIIRSDIVLYEEPLDNEVMLEAVNEIQKAELLIVGGTSLSVYPAAGLINYQKTGGKLALINLGSTSCLRFVDCPIDAPIADVFSKLEQRLLELCLI